MFSPLIFPHFCLLIQCTNTSSSLYIHIPFLCNSDIYAVFSLSLTEISIKTLSSLFLGLQVTEKQTVLPGWTACASQLCSWPLSASAFCKANNLAVHTHLRDSKLHISIKCLSGQLCIFLMYSSQVKNYMKSLKPQTTENGDDQKALRKGTAQRADYSWWSSISDSCIMHTLKFPLIG